MNLKENLFNPFFSHIYVEKNAMNYETVNNIISHFSNSKIIEINHYKDIFCRSHQSYMLQEQSPKLILAVKSGNLIYKGANVCNNFGNENFYYTSCIMNCIYDCEYCYLQGMYQSANIVVFVNIEDIFDKLKEFLNIHSVYLCISYDTDILAFENILGYVNKWVDFARKHKNLTIELRTKSSNFKSISKIEPIDNVILAWTLSPQEIIEKFEHNTPSLEQRISNINNALNKKWKVRLCFEPIVYEKGFREVYSNFIKYLFSSISYESIYDISIGTFRVSSEYLKIMKKQRPNSIILNYPFKNDNGVFHYENEISESILLYVYNLINEYISKDKIYVWKENK